MEFKPGLIVFGRRLIIKRLVWPDGVVGLVPGLQLPVMILHSEGDILDLVKLNPMGLVGTLDVALKFWGSRRDDEETDPPDPAGLFEVLLELRATIDLDGPDREGELAFHVLEEQRGGEARGVPIGLGDIPAGDEVPLSLIHISEPTRRTPISYA